MNRKSVSRIPIAIAVALCVTLASLAGLAAAQSSPGWQPGIYYATSSTVTYGGLTYTCLQAHTSQVGWEPPNVPALWKTLAGATPTASSTSTATVRPTASPTPRNTATATPTATTRPTSTATATSRPTATSTATGTAVSCAAAWNAATAYTAGGQASRNGQNYQAAFWTQGQDPATNSGPAGSGQPWIPTSACDGAAPRALILVDSRLYANLESLLEEYRTLAQARRGFDIALRAVNGIDDWSYAQVKSYVVSERANNPQLEGVLFVGNIKLPSFYKSRNDTNFTRLLPRYYEDLDGVFAKNHPDGSVDPQCTDFANPDCYVYGPSTIPAHDFDFTDKGPNPDPEIWAAFLPVGYASGGNTYADFATQLTPYLQKVIRYYNHQIANNGRYYFVTGDKGETFETTWDAFGKYDIDLWGKPGPNGETGEACLTASGNVCYQRWPIESYSDAASFIADYDKLWVGEGWQQDSIFLGHMNAAAYQVVEVNTHANETWSLVGSEQARGITQGGLLVALDGCGVSGFRQPGSPSWNDASVWVDGNLAAAYVYGSSNAIAVLGDPFWRGHYAHYPTLYREMRLYGAYLGAAHLAQMKKQYAISTSWGELRENGMEMLIGDPFMDLN